MSDEAFDFFAVFNRFIRDGWMGRLKPNESCVWLGLLSHANKSGEAWPSASRLASYLGHSTPAHVRTARAALERAGLLRRVSNGGGRHTSIFALCLPTLPDSGGFPESDRGQGPFPKSDKGPLPKVGPAASAKSDSSPFPESGNRRTNRTTKEHTNNTSGGNGGGGGEVPSDEQRASYEAVAALCALGAWESRAVELVGKVDGLTPEIVTAAHAEIIKAANVKNIPSALLARLEEDGANLVRAARAKADEARAEDDRRRGEREAWEAALPAIRQTIADECEARYFEDADAFDAELARITDRHGDITLKLAVARLERLNAMKIGVGGSFAWSTFPRGAGVVLAVDQYRTGETFYGMGDKPNAYADGGRWEDDAEEDSLSDENFTPEELEEERKSIELAIANRRARRVTATP